MCATLIRASTVAVGGKAGGGGPYPTIWPLSSQHGFALALHSCTQEKKEERLFSVFFFTTVSGASDFFFTRKQAETKQTCFFEGES